MFFGIGGFHGGEGDDTADNWYIENVLEELDWPTEFIFAPDGQQLLYFFNQTGDSENVQFVATNLVTLINITGSGDELASNIFFGGITFATSARSTYSPHGVPSGGDWGLERDAAIMLQDTSFVNFDGCLFTKLDGNGVMLNGFNLNTTIQNSEFSYIGNTAMGAWGITDYWNGTDLNVPQYTNILYNLCHEIGHYEKQSACWFQAKTTLSNLVGNIFFNVPRAAINFNDGFGGGNNVEQCLVFNTCRESTDHGPINSWSVLLTVMMSFLSYYTGIACRFSLQC